MIRPMLATLGDLPRPHGWGYEVKWDGVRAIVTLDRGTATIASHNDRDVADTYPELRALLDRFGRRQVVLDGETVTLDRKGHSCPWVTAISPSRPRTWSTGGLEAISPRGAPPGRHHTKMAASQHA